MRSLKPRARRLGTGALLSLIVVGAMAGPTPPPSPTARRRPTSRWSSPTAAPPATGPSTRSRPTRSPPAWAPTTSSPTSSRPRTACSWPATRTRSRGTTDVADHPEFARRRTTKTIDGVQLTGWFTEDFTLAELKTLRAKERIPAIRQRNTIYDGRYKIPTFQEVIDLARRLSRELGRRDRHLPRDEAPDVLPRDRQAARGAARARCCAETASTAAARRCSSSRSRTANLKQLDRALDVPLVQLFGGAATRP